MSGISVFFALFAAFLRELCDKKLLNAKIAKNDRKGREEKRGSLPGGLAILEAQG